MALKLKLSKAPLSESELTTVEQRLGIHFPPQYRAFLLKYNGGKPQPSASNFKNDDGGSSIERFFAIHKGNETDLETALANLMGLVPPNFIPIAEDGGGNVICMSVSGADMGAVYFCDHEEMTDTPSHENIHLIADNFDEFVDNLCDPKQWVPDEIYRIVNEGDTQGLEQLLTTGFHIDSKDEHGLTFIEKAAMYEKVELYKYLVKKGAAPGRSLEFAERLNRAKILELQTDN